MCAADLRNGFEVASHVLRVIELHEGFGRRLRVGHVDRAQVDVNVQGLLAMLLRGAEERRLAFGDGGLCVCVTIHRAMLAQTMCLREMKPDSELLGP